MPPKRRGSQTASSSTTWTELFQRIAPVVLQQAVGTYPVTVNQEVPAIAKIAVQNSTRATNTNLTTCMCQRKPNKKDCKVNNITHNKKGDVSTLTSATTTNASIVGAAASQRNPNIKNSKVDNVTHNKKGDVSKLTSATTTNASIEGAAPSQIKPNIKDSKVDNITNNKKGTVSTPNIKNSKVDNVTNGKKGAVSTLTSAITTNESIVDAAASPRKPNIKESKVNNVTHNKKSDVSKLTSATTTNAVTPCIQGAAPSQIKPNIKDSKVDNITNNKKGTVSTPNIKDSKVDNVTHNKKSDVSTFTKSTSATSTNANIGDQAASQREPNKNSKVDNVTYNQKGDDPTLTTSSTSATTTNASIVSAAVRPREPNTKDNKVDNVTHNKNGDVPALTSSTSATTTNATIVGAAASQKEPNKKYNKADNVTHNKIGDASTVTTNRNNYDCGSEEECARCCQEAATENLSDTELLVNSFVHVELKDDVKCNILPSISAVIHGLPDHVNEYQVLKQLAEEQFYPITVVRKIACKGFTDSFFLVQVPKFIESRLLIMHKLLDYKVDVEKEGPEHILIDDFTECKISDHGKTNFSASNSIADLGYTSVNSHLSNESINKPDIFSSSRNSIPNYSPSVKEECDQSSVPKEAYIRDTRKLLHELRQIKKEVEEIKFELKINDAKKVNSDYLHVILQGIPPEIKNEDIINDLKSKQFSVNTVYRLRNESNEATDEVVFELPKTEDHIFYFSCCLGFEVQVEEYKDDFSNLQCNHTSFNTFNTDISPKKPINILFRGIPTDIPESDILRDLEEKRFHPIAIHSMVPTHRYLLGKITQVVLVQVPSEEEHIYELSCILGYPVTVEEVDKGTLNVAQCKTCMQFGHSTKTCSGKTTSKVVSNIPAQKSKINNDVPILNAVVKGVPIEFDDEIVLSDLIKNGFNPISIHRMIVNEEILPTYLVQVPERETRILVLTCCLGFSVKVEEFLPHLYHVEQCRKCSQFGHSDQDCRVTKPIVLPANTNRNMVQTIGTKESTNESISDFDNSDKIETEINKKESSFTSPMFTNSFQYNLSKMDCSKQQQQLLADKLDNFEVILKDFITKNNENNDKVCSCSMASNISTNNTATNTDNTYAQLGEMEQAIMSYQDIFIQFLKNMGLFAQTFMGLDYTVKDFSKVFETYSKLQDLPGVTTSFVEAMIRILKSTIIIMLNIPNLPGVTINTINEQLHLLEELRNIKINMDGTPARFTEKYDVNFPKLQ